MVLEDIINDETVSVEYKVNVDQDIVEGMYQHRKTLTQKASVPLGRSTRTRKERNGLGLTQCQEHSLLMNTH